MNRGSENNRGGGGGGRRGRRQEQEDSGLIERVVQIRRVTKVTKGGGNLTFTALVVVGDGKGNVGVGLGRAKAVPDAVRKGTSNARKDISPVILSDTTIPHEVVSKYGAAKVLLKPAAPGTGVIAGGGVRAAMEAAGVKDVLSKTFGSSVSVGWVTAPESVDKSIDSNAVRTSDALSGLSDGSLERSRNISASKGLGQSGLCHVGATGGVLMC